MIGSVFRTRQRATASTDPVQRLVRDETDLGAAAASADIVFDCVGGEPAARLLTVSPGATFVSYGLLSGKPFRIPAPAPRVTQLRLRDHVANADPATWRCWF